MSRPINPAEIAAKMPHIDAAALQGRTMLLMPVWDGTAWSMWVDAPPGQLTRVQVVEPIRSNYLATVPADKYDFQIPLVDFMWQRASWPEVARQIMGVCHDFHQLATIAAKLEHLHETRETIDANLLTSFVQSEVEQLIIVARSIFDLLQEIMAYFWNDRISLQDPAAEATRRPYKSPDTFAKIALNGELPRTADEITQRYGIPPRTSAMYAKNAQFFVSLRKSRDALVHGGSSVDHVFATEKGFCVDPRSKYYNGFVWKAEHYYNENIVSLRPWIAHTVFRTIEACSETMSAFACDVPFPPPIAPAHKIYIRDPANKALVRLLQVDKGDLIWWGREHDEAACELDSRNWQ
ncbi:MAG: hypothetical protein ABSG88_05265 [Bradyrhizobium sp.]|jgi:hypothetical protein